MRRILSNRLTAAVRLAACVWILAAATVLAQRSVPSLVIVDFLAVDENGRPVTDLTTNEVVVRVGGQAVDVQSLRFMRSASDFLSRATHQEFQPFGSSEAEDFERKFLLAIDEESLPQGSEQSTREAIGAFVGKLGARDQVALVIVPHGGVRVRFTTDHGQVARAVGRLSGRAIGSEAATDAACRTQNVLRELNSMFSAAANPFGPITRVLFSGSLYDGGTAVQAAFGTFMACNVQMNDFRQLGLGAAKSRSYVYIIQPETFGDLQWSSSPRSGLEQLAGVTGGRILQLSGRDLEVLDRVRLETSAVYVALVGVAHRLGSLQALSVKTSRSGVSIVARPQIQVPTDGAAPR